MELWFHWKELLPDELRRANESREEDIIVACVPIEVREKSSDETKYFIVDIHHEKYVGERPCFDLELYASNEVGHHLGWLGSNKEIKTATSYNEFCRRAESIISTELYFWCKEVSDNG